MNPALIAKVIMLTGGISLGGVGIWQLKEHISPGTIREKLEGEGKTFPSTTDDADLTHWKTLHDNNNTATPETDKVDVSSESGDGENADGKKMRSACKKLMEKDLSTATEEEIGRVRKRCTKPTT